MSTKPLRVGLLWHSLASGNLGVDALTASSIALLAEEAASIGLVVEPIVIGMDDSQLRPPRRNDVCYFPIRRKTLLTSVAFWRLAGELDCVIDIGAGDSFADIYGFKRFAYLWLTKFMLIARGTPLLLAPQTIGPFSNGLARRLAAWVLSRSQAVITRDRPSVDLVRAIAPGAAVEQGVDVAFELPFSDRSTERGGSRVRVGINVSGLLADQAKHGKNRFQLSYNYLATMEKLVARFTADPRNEVFVFTHVTTSDPSDDDGWVADAIVKQVQAAKREPDFANAQAAKSFISSLDFVVSARMHACVAALSSGVPVIPIAYSRKFAGLFGGIGYDVEIPVRGFDNESVVETIISLFDDRDLMKQKVNTAQSLASARTVVYRNAVRRILKQVSLAL
jgi:polysaccharide pyruvyl transferase WcaK-like protein